MFLYPLIPSLEGKALGQNIYDDNGNVLLKKGVILKQSYIKKLLKMGYFEVYIQDELSEGVDDTPLLKEETKRRAVLTIKKIMQDYESRDRIQYQDVCGIVSHIVDELMDQNCRVISLQGLKAYDSYTFYHSINVCALSVMLARWCYYTKDRLIELGMGALLHDLGKQKIPREILNKRDKLSDEEWEYIKKHPGEGYEAIKKVPQLSSICAHIAYQHHERIDGKGYPRGLQGDEILTQARIASIADVFDAITSQRPYRKKMLSYKAVEVMEEFMGTQFDEEFLKIFLNSIAVYPNGSVVELENDLMGIVLKQNTGNNRKPRVKIIGQRVSDMIVLLEPYELDLEFQELSIKRAWERYELDKLMKKVI